MGWPNHEVKVAIYNNLGAPCHETIFFNHFSPRRPVSDKEKILVDHAVDHFNDATDRRFSCPPPASSQPPKSLQISEHLGKSSIKKDMARSFEALRKENNAVRELRRLNVQ
ncbi:hypothetical protein O988_06835 [Pseudogymnoascus sp. VKM F-3808]|nr:hypothetical protein O988_06835 [Pseudogymnoascus sp. VKM F-3808]